MPEENAAPETEQQPANTEKAESKSGQESEFEPITSQEQLNKIIADRVGRERSKYSDYKDLKQKAQRLDELDEQQKSDLQKLTDSKAEVEKARDQEQAERLRIQVAFEEGVSKDDLQFLAGNDEESLRALAKRLAVKPAGVGAYVPEAGKQPEKLGTLAEQISAAEAEGDQAKVASLKTQQLFN